MSLAYEGTILRYNRLNVSKIEVEKRYAPKLWDPNIYKIAIDLSKKNTLKILPMAKTKT